MSSASRSSNAGSGRPRRSKTVRLADYGSRKPAQLSGGQRQRVALARALVNRPKVLLLDEPLGALDLKLRQAMQLELKQIQRDVGITFVFVTHDQDEALTMSDRIAVFNDGRIEQVGPPEEVYERPASAFVAGFVGTSNLLGGRGAESVIGRPGLFSIRPEKIRIDGELSEPAAAGDTSATGTVTDVVYAGATVRYAVALDAGRAAVGRPAEHRRRFRRRPRPAQLAPRTQFPGSRSVEGFAMKNRKTRLAGILGVSLLVAACGTSGSNSAAPPGAQGFTPPKLEALKALGQPEGQLNVLAWPGYAENGSNDPKVNWVTPFEQQTGCKVNVKPFGTSDEAVTLMKTGGYDVVSASGDASLRLVASGDVEPVNTALVPNYADVQPFLKDKSWNSVGGVSYGVPHGWGANLLTWRTDKVTPAPTSWSVMFDANSPYKGKVIAYDSPIYIADAALYLMAHQPDLGIKNPYALDDKQFTAAVEPAQAAASAGVASTGRTTSRSRRR